MKKILVFIPYLLPILLIVTGWQFRQTHTPNVAGLAHISIPGFQQSQTENGMLKFENEDALIYIKPAVKAFQGSHDPRICWSGSGYEFTKITKTTIDETKIYTALLTKGNDQLHTAWWFDNGTIQTIDEWQWRWTTLSGKSGFRLVNVTTARQEDLLMLSKNVMRNVMLVPAE